LAGGVSCRISEVVVGGQSCGSGRTISGRGGGGGDDEVDVVDGRLSLNGRRGSCHRHQLIVARTIARVARCNRVCRQTTGFYYRSVVFEILPVSPFNCTVSLNGFLRARLCRMSALSPDQTVSLCLAPLLLFYCLFVRNKVDWKYALQGHDARRIMDKV